MVMAQIGPAKEIRRIPEPVIVPRTQPVREPETVPVDPIKVPEKVPAKQGS